MNGMSSDGELVTAYAANASDTAFRALVSRHVDLVYATALRQVGDRGLAQEITQNAFVALARKAPRLAGVETLAGWLHRTTILEAKACLRAELRRRRREAKAIELATLEREGGSPFAELVPLLDEALLNLRERDRLALVLRFWEDRSLREVGTALGVDEDAARKRIARALDRLSEFFRQRGFAAPAGSASAILLAGAAHGAPAGLVTAAANAGIAAGVSASGLNLILLHFMNLTHTQTAVACALLAAAPLAWQWQAAGNLAREQAAVTAQLATARRMASDLEAEGSRTRQRARRTQLEAQSYSSRLAALNDQLSGRAPRPVYRWDDASPFVRVPKRLVEQLSLSALANKHGELAGSMKEILQLTDAEARRVQGAIDRFLADYNAAEALKTRTVPAAAQDLSGHKPEETRVFEVASLGGQLGAMRESLFGELATTLGVERFELLRQALGSWMPLDDETQGLGSDRAVFNCDRRVRFYQPKPGERNLYCSIAKADGSSVGAPVPLEDLPDNFRGQLQDWIDLARSQPPEAAHQ